MASTYVNNLRLEEIATGEQSGTWGNTTNTNLEIIGQVTAWGTRAIANASTDNITIADGALDADRSLVLKLTGGGQACTVTLLPNTSSKTWVMYNTTSATLTFTCGSGANVAVPAGEAKIIATDGLGSGGVVHDVLTGVNLAGNAATATTLETARTIAGVSFDGSANISLNNNAITNGAGYTTNVGDITGVTAGTGISGGGTSGTVTITNSAPNVVQTTVSGNAGTATTLETARTIAGVSFDGSANISLNNNAITNGAGYTTNTGDITGVTAGTGISGGGTSGTVTITNSAPNIVQTTVSGSSGSCTGNAATATTLATARTIAGVSFNGSANISLNNNAITNGAGYTTNTGDITGVTAGTGLTGGGTSGTVTLNVGTLNQNTTGSSGSCTGNAATASAAVLIKVNNYTSTTDMRILGSHQTGGSDNVYSNSSMYLNCDTGIINAAGFYASGNITAYSDKRVKTNFEKIPNALEKVSKLSGYTFDRTDIEDEDGNVKPVVRQTGVIAQEVLEVLPEAVSQNPKDGMYGVAYGNMVGLLIEAIKELKAEVEELKGNK